MTTTTAIIPRPFTDAMSANDHKRQVEALATLGELGARVVTLTQVGWCPRNGGHFCGPDPEYGPDDGSCGSKYSHTAMMTEWEGVEE